MSARRGGMDERTYAVSEAIARVAWDSKVEDEQSKTEFEINAPEFDDLGNHREYLINDARKLARAAIAVLTPETRHLQAKVDRVEALRDELYLAAHGAGITPGVQKLLDKIDAALEDRE